VHTIDDAVNTVANGVVLIAGAVVARHRIGDGFACQTVQGIVAVGLFAAVSVGERDQAVVKVILVAVGVAVKVGVADAAGDAP